MKPRSVRLVECIFVVFMFVVVLATAVRVAAQARATPAAQKPAAMAPPGNADDGKKLFVSFGCYECHGYEAQGSTTTGPRLGPRPIAFAAFLKYVRQPTNQMPPFTAKVVSDTDLAHIYAFLQTRPAALQDIPLLK